MFNRRLVTFLLCVAAGLLLIVGRLVHLQLVRGSEQVQKAEKAMRSSQLLATTRGKIYDRANKPNGRETLVVALDQPCYDFCMDYAALTPEGVDHRARTLARKTHITPEEAHRRLDEQIDETLNRAAEIAGVSRADVDENIQRVVGRVTTYRRLVGTRVREEEQSHAVIAGLTEAQAVAMRAELDKMAFASVQPGTRRYYPYDSLACHVIGRTAAISGEQQRQDPNANDPLRRYLDNETTGVSGVEKMCEGILRGVRGQEIRRRTGQVLEFQPAQLGQDVHLTVDMQLQQALYDILAKQPQNGAIVVLDVASGEILAMVSKPTYNLNTYAADFPQLINNKVELPLMNRALSAYPPGSGVKPITALGAMAEGVITPDTVIDCTGGIPNQEKFHCSNRNGHGPLDLRSAIMHSCNMYFFRVGERLHCERLTEWMRRFGLGESSGMPGESAGLVPSVEWLWKHENRGTFFTADAWNMAIGQGFVLATPLQVANVMATIARDGEYVSPRLTQEFPREQQRRSLGFSTGALQAVQEGMYRVVNDPSGTAYNYARHPEIEICGKTGTAQTSPRRVDVNGDGKPDILQEGYMAWFAGFAPYRHPKIAFAVLLEYVPTGGGGSNCGPIARELVTICQQLGYISQTGVSSPTISQASPN